MCMISFKCSDFGSCKIWNEINVQVMENNGADIFFFLLSVLILVELYHDLSLSFVTFGLNLIHVATVLFTKTLESRDSKYTPIAHKEP